MKIYIMRHGEAGYSASSDSTRPLTPVGEKQCLSVANWLSEQQITFELGLVSPYLRAQQTYSIIAKAVPISQTEKNPLLTPGGCASHVVDHLTMLALSGVKSVLIVSHLPLVGYLVNELCPHIAPPMFSTADIACISLSQDSQGELEWFHHPV